MSPAHELRRAAECCRVAAEAFETACGANVDADVLIMQGLSNLQAGRALAASALQEIRRQARRARAAESKGSAK